MTREEQIKKAAHDFSWGWCDDMAHPLNNGFIKGAEWADQHPQWIHVKERLPKIPEKWYCVEVLFRTKDSANHLGKYFGDDDKWISYEDYTFKTNDISHWMPIVPPRKEDKK